MVVTAGHVTAALVATVALVIKLAALRRDPSNRKIQASVAICAGLGIAVTAGWAPVHSWIDRVAGAPNLAKVVEHGYLGVTVVDILRMSHAYARYASARLRITLRLLSAGAAFGAGFVAHKALFIALRLAEVDPPWPEPVVTQTLVSLSVVLICSSFVLAALWKMVDGVRAWPRRSTLYRDLHPLWYLLYRAVPTIALHRPRHPHRDSWWVWDAGQQLYRRCVEFGDGLRELGPRDPEVASQARRRAVEAGWDEARASAAGDAAAILVAARRFASRRPASDGGEPGLEPQPSTMIQADVEAEARRLALISVALSAEVVTGAVAQFLAAQDPT
ncbi:MAB_1171c family putative transporter [Micromonospora sp. KC213]|uniref:MAB_1171c family putative transporter n=1 Tax=Micromonospora sp. KC213 TaxID=2530378 RepID=UPI0010513A3A|nr:MAB_1171c family putative transporter [Micromonospora sp. KC213]TDC42841.1 hypothetical protein E1166_06050 [Micromonospora sp. KC213]